MTERSRGREKLRNRTKSPIPIPTLAKPNPSARNRAAELKEIPLRNLQRLAVVAAPMVGIAALLAVPATAGLTSVAELSPIEGNGVVGGGSATVSVSGSMINVSMKASGLLADHPHAAHIHFGEQARHECPTLADDSNMDGHLNTTEGVPAYGPVALSLTTSGDTSPSSALAIDRYSTAPGGVLEYQRSSIKTSRAVAKAIEAGQAVVVIHGVDHNNDGTYSGDTPSDLAPSLPTEATDPALCGVLSNAPHGGMETGSGGAAGGQNTALIALGGGALLAAAGSGVLTARRARTQAC